MIKILELGVGYQVLTKIGNNAGVISKDGSEKWDFYAVEGEPYNEKTLHEIMIALRALNSPVSKPMRTMISLQVLKEWNACAPALAAFEKVYGEASVPWTELIEHPACLGEWSLWVRRAVARHGNAADHKALRNDPDELVRRAVAEYGSAADRKVLRNDPNEEVRWVVAEYGSAADRKVLRNDPSEYVRRVVARYGNAADREVLRNDPDELVRRAVAMYGKND